MFPAEIKFVLDVYSWGTRCDEVNQELPTPIFQLTKFLFEDLNFVVVPPDYAHFPNLNNMCVEL